MRSVLIVSATLIASSTAENPALALDRSYPRATAGAIRALYDDAPQIPFTNFSAAYVRAALASPTDWRTRGAVTPAKNQGPHGFCGTFGRCGEMEGGWVLRGGKPLTNFSEQALVSCIGWDRDQFSFFNPKGFMTSEDYPYNLSHYPDVDPPIPNNPCRFDATKVVPDTPKFFTFTTGRAPTEDQMAAFIHHNGPVSAGIGAEVFGLREKGCEARGDCFINATACATQNTIDHSVTVVGYGTDAVKGDYCTCTGVECGSVPRPLPYLHRTRERATPSSSHSTLSHAAPYPFHPPPLSPSGIIKNSWSEKFANNGFINVQRGVQCGGMCGDPSICGNLYGTGDPASYYE